MAENQESAERELNFRCKIIYDLTKEMVENDTKANRRFFFWAYHEIWMLKSFPKCLASKKAYNLFYEIYNKDIREYNWFNKEIIKCRDSKNKRLFMHEHLTTSNDFQQELISLYKNNQLSIDKVKELILQQRICWVTREEDDKLTKMGYKDHRPNPLQAYADCGIEIYQGDKEALTNIMNPSFCIQPSPLISSTRFIETNKISNPTEDSIDLLETIKNNIVSSFPDYNVHYSMSYIQIWKKSWNNQGKQGIHFELTPRQNKGFCLITNEKQFVITFKLHNEKNTRHVMPQIPTSKIYFKKEYCFQKGHEKKSISNLLSDISIMINNDEKNIDNAHNF